MNREGEVFYAKCQSCNAISRWRRGVLRPPDGRVHGACPSCGSTSLVETAELPALEAHQQFMSGAPR